MTDVSTSTVTSVTVPARDLVDGLTAVLPHVGTDSTLPVLAAMRIEIASDGVTLVGTDRYTLATYSVPLADDTAAPTEPLAVLVERKDVATVLRVAKDAAKALGGYSGVTLTVADGCLTATDAAIGSSATVLTVAGEYPRYSIIFDAAEDAWRDRAPTLVQSVAFNPAYLARFAKAAERNAPIRTRTVSPSKPVLVDASERFRGLVMPVRLPS